MASFNFRAPAPKAPENAPAYASKAEILAAVAAGKLSPEAAGQMLVAEAAPKSLTFKVSEKGAVSVYGLQRMPVTLYAQQWARLLDEEAVKALLSFIEANKSKLSYK